MERFASFWRVLIIVWKLNGYGASKKSGPQNIVLNSDFAANWQSSRFHLMILGRMVSEVQPKLNCHQALNFEARCRRPRLSQLKMCLDIFAYNLEMNKVFSTEWCYPQY